MYKNKSLHAGHWFDFHEWNTDDTIQAFLKRYPQFKNYRLTLEQFLDIDEIHYQYKAEFIVSWGTESQHIEWIKHRLKLKVRILEKDRFKSFTTKKIDEVKDLLNNLTISNIIDAQRVVDGYMTWGSDISVKQDKELTNSTILNVYG